MKEIQIIGLDIGRGFVKGYTQVNGIEKECLFKSVIGEGRNIDLKNYKEPIMIEFEEDDWFIGLLAEKESQTPIRNIKDSKTTKTVKTLIAAGLSKLAVEEKVKVMLGVPYKLFRKSILNEVIEEYKGKTIKVKDKINGGSKEVKIVDISIYRESDAALLWELKDKPNTKPVGVASIGFRTTELSYFDKDLMFNDKKSDTIEFANISALSNVKDKLLEQGIIKEVNEIDSSDEYKELKDKAYKIVSENIEQQIEGKWINLNEMDVYIAGGTALNMKFDNKFKLVKDTQMATAKGLYLVGTRIFK